MRNELSQNNYLHRHHNELYLPSKSGLANEPENWTNVEIKTKVKEFSLIFISTTFCSV